MSEITPILIVFFGFVIFIYCVISEIISFNQRRNCKHKNQHRHSNLRVCLDCGRKSYGPIE